MRRSLLLIALLAALLFAVETWRETRPRQAIPVGPALPEVALVDQAGRRLPLGATVFTFAFFHDALHAPETLSQVRALAEELRGRAAVVTLTLAPDEDSPEHLPSVAAAVGVAPPWSLASGAPAEVTSLLEALDVDWQRLQSERAKFGTPIFPETRAVVVDAEGHPRGDYDLSSWTERRRLRAELSLIFH